MPEAKPSAEQHAPIWGIFLLFLGVVFLLQSLNVLPWALWGTLWRFWPVWLIITGMALILRRYNVWLVSVLIMALLLASLGIAIGQYEPPTPPGQSTRTEPLDGLEQAQIEIDFAAGSLAISSLSSGSPNFVEASSGARSENSRTRVDFYRQGNEGRLVLSQETVSQPSWHTGGNTWQVRLTRNIPLTFNIKSAASNTDLDLSSLLVTELRLELAAGNGKVTLPSATGVTRADIKSEVANLEVNIPAGVAASIEVEADLSALDINERRFRKQGNDYISDNFDTADSRLYLTIDSAVGRIQVR